MAQWPFQMPTVAATDPVTAAPIPEEWQKAIQALEAVKPKSGNNENSSTKTEQTPVVDVSNQFDWQNSYTGYPGYAGYPASYGYYNYNNNYVVPSYPMYMNNMPVPSQQLAPIPSTSVLKNEDSELKMGEKSLLPSVTSQPPPPPPSPPENLNGPTFYTDISAKQAPGSGGIKFTLPKKKNQNKSFQQGQGILQNRTNNFQSYSDNSFQDNSENMKQSILHQKSVSSMSKDKWPPCLKNYVNDCFNKCKNDIDKDQVEIILKGKLVRAFNDGTIFTKDWSKEPLPSTHSERLEMEQKMSTFREQQQKLNTPLSSKIGFQHHTRNYRSRSRSHSRSRSLSRSRSRSHSRTPPRKVIRKKRHSSSSSESSEDSRKSKKVLSSSVIGPSDFHNQKNISKNKKKNKKKGNKMSFTVDPEFSTDERLQKRAARFETKGNKKKQSNTLVFTISNPFVVDETGDFEWNSSDAIIGTSLDLEKPFLRLTGAVDPSSVRPEEILIKSLAMVKKRWVENQDYHFACEQLKSIRQDLVVQCIRNQFTVQVYETHARIALEKGDHTEFNQCQSQLKVLYEDIGEGNRLEFTGYYILYTIYTENTLEMKNILANLSDDDKKDEVVSHALQIAKAWSNNNYHRFFKLYIASPMMSSFIIDWFIERIRKTALKAIIKSYVYF